MTSRRDRNLGAAAELASEASISFGSSIAGLLIPVVGSVVVVAARQLVTTAALLPLTRPHLEGIELRKLWPALALGVIIAITNLSFYEAVGRIGLGITVTIEFLGPLAIALITSRRLLDLSCAVAAGAGVYLLAGTDGTLDAVGITLALVSGAGWAAYILVTRKVAMSFTGLNGLAIASIVALAITLPPALFIVDYHAVSWSVIGLLVATGLLCSAIPYSLDIFVLRRITPRLYAIITSCAPVIAAIFGWLILREPLSIIQQVAILLVCTAAATAIATQRERPVSLLEASATGTV